MLRSHTCDGLNGVAYELAHGRESCAGKLYLPNKPYGECCVRIGDLAKKAAAEFDVPLSRMKLSWKHKLIMSSYDKEKEVQLSSLGVTRKAGKFNVYGCETEDEGILQLRRLEVTYRKLTQALSQLLTQLANLEKKQNQTFYSLYNNEICKRLWLQIQRKGEDLEERFGSIINQLNAMELTELNRKQCERSVCCLRGKCEQSASHSQVLVEKVRQHFTMRDSGSQYRYKFLINSVIM